MKVVQQTEKIERIEIPTIKSSAIRHNRLFPSTMRCIIAGPSGCGKTDLLLTLLLNKNGLKFKNLYVIAKTIDQQKYQFLSEVLRKIPEIGYYSFNKVEELKLEDIKNDSVVIFDDVITGPQNTLIRDIYSFGRHGLMDVLYLTQTLTKVPKHLIRDNATVYVLFKQDMRNLKNFYNDNISTDITFKEFVDMCMHCWDKSHGYIVINLECNKNNGRFREGFDNFFIL